MQKKIFLFFSIIFEYIFGIFFLSRRFTFTFYIHILYYLPTSYLHLCYFILYPKCYHYHCLPLLTASYRYLLVIYIYAILSYIQNATTTIAYRFLPLLTATYRFLPLLTAAYRYLPLLQLLSTLVDLLPNVIYYIFAICSYIIN